MDHGQSGLSEADIDLIVNAAIIKIKTIPRTRVLNNVATRFCV